MDSSSQIPPRDKRWVATQPMTRRRAHRAALGAAAVIGWLSTGRAFAQGSPQEVVVDLGDGTAQSYLEYADGRRVPVGCRWSIETGQCIGPGATEEIPAPAQPRRTVSSPSLEFWGPDPGTFAPMATVVQMFKAKYPNVDVKVGGGSLNISAATQEKFLVAIIAGNPPDVSYIDRYIPRSYAALGAIVPLDEMIRGSTVKPEEWWPYLRTDVTHQDRVYGIPMHTDARLFSWNKEHFRELGVNPDRPPANWDELASISARLVKRDGGGKLTRAGFMPWGGGFGTHGLPFFVHLWQGGGEALDATERRPRFQEPPGVRALDWMMSVARQIGGAPGYAELVNDLPTGPGLDAFSVGRLSMQIHGVTIWRDYVNNVRILNFGLSEVPMPTGGQAASYTGGFALCMAKNSPHADAGFAFMEHWLTDETQFAWADQIQAVPSVRRVAESEEWIKADKVPQFRLREVQNAAVRSAKWVPTRPGSSELVDLWIADLITASQLKLSAQDVLGEMARKSQVILDKWISKYGS